MLPLLVLENMTLKSLSDYGVFRLSFCLYVVSMFYRCFLCSFFFIIFVSLLFLVDRRAANTSIHLCYFCDLYCDVLLFTNLFFVAVVFVFIYFFARRSQSLVYS